VTLDLNFVLAVYVFMLTVFLGIELINRVPATLHTPLMSATNAIHGIVLIGAMLVAGAADNTLLHVLGLLGVILGAGNAVGGFAVTDRMLEMFKQRLVEGR
jgi:H+-translocating NAD(P) transhydrogenase subunit alpha